MIQAAVDSKRISVVWPIHLDRVIQPIPTQLRVLTEWIPEVDFYSFSSPVTDEDRAMAETLWQQDNVHRIELADLVRMRFDIAHHASAGRKNFLACKIARLRTLGWTRHLFTACCQPYPTHPRRELLIRCVKYAQHVVTVSEIVAREFEDILGPQVDRVITNGFDERFYFPSGDHRGVRERIQTDRPFVLFSSSLIDRKKPEFIVGLARRMPDVQFVVVGGGAPSEFRDQRIRELEETPNVIFLGVVARSELRDLMQAAEVFLHPSEYEGMPMTVIEALGTGLPVIAQPKSSLPEVITHDDNGWLIDIAEEDAWIARIRAVLGMTAEQKHAVKARCRETMLAGFTWRNVARQYYAYYCELVGRGGGPPGGERD